MPTIRKHTSKPRAATRAKAAVRMLSHAQIPRAVATLAEPKGTARFAAGKALTVTAEKDPVRVYPHFDAIAALLTGDCKIVRWNEQRILALLTPADSAGRIDALLDEYLAPIGGGNLIAGANAVGGAAIIARHRPDLRGRILPAILVVEQANYETPECRNVAIGQTLDALREFGPDVCREAAVVGFIRRAETNPRAAVAQRAKRLMKKLAGRA